jgi:hypothetical protein
MQRLKLRLIYALGMLTPLGWAARHIDQLDADTALALKHLFS